VSEKASAVSNTRVQNPVNPAVVPWGLCDPSPLWLTFFFRNCHEYWYRLLRIFS